MYSKNNPYYGLDELSACEDEFNRQYVHRDEIPNLEECKNVLQDIIDSIYSNKSLDICKLDDDITYLSDLLGAKTPTNQPKIKRRREENINLNWLQEATKIAYPKEVTNVQ